MNWKHVALVCGMSGAFSALAFVPGLTSAGNQKRWDLSGANASVHTNIVNRNSRAIRYFLATDAWSTTNTAAELNALRASFAQWQSVSGTVLKFEEAGPVAPGVDVNTSDHSNVVFWAKTSTIVNGGLNNISGALGVTFSSFFSDGTFVEGDIVFNGVLYGWFTDASTTTTTNHFIEGTALHEMGHFIGLDHSPLGGATMFASSASGISSDAGLSTDDISGARFLYAQTNQAALRGTLRGSVTRNGTNVFGAAIVAEGTNGTVVAGTVTRTNGIYELSALLPGSYLVRAVPLDSSNAVEWLARGRDISSTYAGAESGFLATTNVPVTLTAGVTNTLNFAVVAAEPAFRITNIRLATANPGSFSWSSLPIVMSQGRSNLTVGVASANLPTNNATLSISGDGLTVGPTVFRTNAFGTGLNFISVLLSIASNATPGLRTFLVQQGTNTAYANGFLDVIPTRPDYNFDGLDDLFQRQYFPLWTATNAAPSADPDGDGFNNASEYVAGTSPTNAASLLRIDQVMQTMAGTTITWRSVAGKRYQVSSRNLFGAGAWQTIGAPVTASGPSANYFDAGANSGQRFYRVEVLP